jgi:DNA modification methylase
MAFADPPYTVSAGGKNHGRATLDDNDSLRAGYQDLLEATCTSLIAVCRGAIYVCTSSSELHTLYQAFTAVGGHWSAFIIWAEHGSSAGRSDYSRQYRPILYGWREGADHYWCGARDQGDVWTIPMPMAKREHPSMKPVELMERAVENSSQPGGTVLDPFAGPGATLIACERRGRRACLIEADPRYVDVICERWEQYSGQPAIRHADSAVFSGLDRDRRCPDPDDRLLCPVDPNELTDVASRRPENEQF